MEGKYYIKEEEKNNKTIDKKEIKLNELQELRNRDILIINPLGETNENILFIDMI